MPKWELITAVVAIGMGLINQLRAIMNWILGLFMVSVACDYSTAGFLIAYLDERAKSSTTVAAYASSKGYIRELNESRTIPYEWLFSANNKIMIMGWRPIFFKKIKDGINGHDYTFSFFRGTIDWEKLLVAACDWRDQNAVKSSSKRYCVHYHHGKTLGLKPDEEADEKPKAPNDEHRQWSRTSGYRLLGRWKHDDIGIPTSGRIDDIALTPELQALVEEITLWSKSRDWYTTRKLPWKRGYAFYGPPGTGKTTMVRGLGITLDMPIHVFDIATMSNEDLRKAWAKMAQNSPCIALFEDVDAVFDGRENVTKFGGLASSGGLTFDCLLNCVDGVERNANGVLVVFTTNDVSKLDRALIDRPGRIDRVTEFGDLDLPARMKIAGIIVEDQNEARRIAEEAGPMPAATFQERCCRIALDKKFGSHPFR